MITPTELEEQRALIGQARSDVGVLLTTLDSLRAVRDAYDQLQLADDAILDDQALLPLGTNRNDLRDMVAAFDALVIFLAAGYVDRLERFARGV